MCRGLARLQREEEQQRLAEIVRQQRKEESEQEGDARDATASLLDEVAAAKEKHSELQRQLEWALTKIDTVMEDNKNLGEEIALAHRKIFDLMELNEELQGVVLKQQNRIECLETEFGSWL